MNIPKYVPARVYPRVAQAIVKIPVRSTSSQQKQSTHSIVVVYATRCLVTRNKTNQALGGVGARLLQLGQLILIHRSLDAYQSVPGLRVFSTSA